MCGIIAVAGYQGPKLRNMIARALLAMQHRGTSAAGLHCFGLPVDKGLGLVSEVFPKLYRDDSYPGAPSHGIGHVRYPTQGNGCLANAQPHVVGQASIVSNGDYGNYAHLRRQCPLPLQTENDAELLLALATAEHQASGDWVQAIASLDQRVQGAYSAAIMTVQGLWVFRDHHGFRPLVLGQHHDSGAWVAASESCAFETIDTELVREVEPGEIIFISRDGQLEVRRQGQPQSSRFCAFEEVYFSYPSSHHRGRLVAITRQELGRRLAQESPAPADLVVAVPDSANYIGEGYVSESRIASCGGLIRRHHVGRTFIAEDDRPAKVRLKFSLPAELIQGKSIVVVDDSIVRGTTMLVLVKLLRQAGAREIHLRIGSPMVLGSCFYGIDTPDKEALLAYRLHGHVEAMRQQLGVDSLAFLSLAGFQEVLGQNYCLACFDGHYPV